MKKVRERTSQITLSTILIISFGLCLLAFAPQVHAQTTGSITIRDSEATGITLKIYQVATLNDNLSAFTATKDAYKSVIDELPFDSSTHADEWTKAANDLHKIVKRDNIDPLQEGTVKNGYLQFANLEPGLYLMDGDPVKIGIKTAQPAPTLISVPTRASTSDPWQYNVVIGKVKMIDPGKITPDNPNHPDNPTPNNPNHPNNPGTPNKPTPNNPGKPSPPNKTTTTQARTGDPTEIGIYVTLLAVTAAALSYAAVMWQRKRRKDNQT